MRFGCKQGGEDREWLNSYGGGWLIHHAENAAHLAEATSRKHPWVYSLALHCLARYGMGSLLLSGGRVLCGAPPFHSALVAFPPRYAPPAHPCSRLANQVRLPREARQMQRWAPALCARQNQAASRFSLTGCQTAGRRPEQCRRPFPPRVHPRCRQGFRSARGRSLVASMPERAPTKSKFR
jgi:hypothetical protein